MFGKNCVFKGSTGKAQQLEHATQFFLFSSQLKPHTPPPHPRQLLIIPGPLILGGLSRLVDCSPSPTSCLHPPLAFWLLYYSFASITQGPVRGNKRQGNTDDSTLLLVGACKILK